MCNRAERIATWEDIHVILGQRDDALTDAEKAWKQVEEGSGEIRVLGRQVDQLQRDKAELEQLRGIAADTIREQRDDQEAVKARILRVVGEIDREVRGMRDDSGRLTVMDVWLQGLAARLLGAPEGALFSAGRIVQPARNGQATTTTGGAGGLSTRGEGDHP